MKAVSPGHQPSSNLMQMALIILQVKKGTQHTKNTPRKKEKKCIKGEETFLEKTVVTGDPLETGKIDEP